MSIYTILNQYYNVSTQKELLDIYGFFVRRSRGTYRLYAESVDILHTKFHELVMLGYKNRIIIECPNQKWDTVKIDSWYTQELMISNE